MSREYVEECIRAALKETKGHAHKAQQKIIAEAAQDQRLLLSLTRGHLTGIVALWINRILTKSEAVEDDPQDEPEHIDLSTDEFGREILKALQDSDTAMFGIEDNVARQPRKKASQNHIDALRLIARKGKSSGDLS